MSTEKLQGATREQLVAQFMHEVSRMSTWSVMFHQAASLQMGLNATDGKSLSVLRETGPITAGELALITGLTTGAITGVIDRLEKRGYVRRIADPNDRRHVIIELVENATNSADVWAIFGPLASATHAFLPLYSDEELATILDFVQRGAEMMKAQTARLQQREKLPTG